ncbi:MAG: hypothetical protein KAH96_07115 [Alphaproteobacteria bacterium]|nr:hypothetical protein [Alphaproteobacteria bacterium]
MPKEEDIRDLTPEFLTAIRKKLNPPSKKKETLGRKLDTFSKKKEAFNTAIMPAIEKLGRYQDKEDQKFKIIRTVPGDKNAFLSAVEYKDNMLYFWTNENSELYAIKYPTKDNNVENLTINFSSLTEAVEFLGDWVAEVAPDIADKIEKKTNKKVNQLNFPL